MLYNLKLYKFIHQLGKKSTYSWQVATLRNVAFLSVYSNLFKIFNLMYILLSIGFTLIFILMLLSPLQSLFTDNRVRHWCSRMPVCDQPSEGPVFTWLSRWARDTRVSSAFSTGSDSPFPTAGTCAPSSSLSQRASRGGQTAGGGAETAAAPPSPAPPVSGAPRASSGPAPEPTRVAEGLDAQDRQTDRGTRL